MGNFLIPSSYSAIANIPDISHAVHIITNAHMSFTYFFSRLSNQNKPWFKNDKKWLVIGKGPSFKNLSKINLSEYYTFGLNHVNELIRCDIAHLIDVEVLSDELIENAKNIILPWHPHKKYRVLRDDLNQLIGSQNDGSNCPEFKFKLRDAYNQDKLYYYYASTYKGHCPFEKELVRVKYFSGEVPFYLLGLCGIREIYSVGIDGGINYAYEFQHLNPLTNGRQSFNDHLPMIRKSCERFGINWVKL